MRWMAPTEKENGGAALEKRLWAAADQFRANSGLKPQEYSGPILGLIFLRLADVRYAAQRAKLWFVHFRFPGHKDHPRVASPLGEIPKGWDVKPLESLIIDHVGGGWGKDAPDNDHTEPAWVVRGTDIPSARRSQVDGVPHRFHTSSNLRTRTLAANDIVFEVSVGSKGQPVGRTLLITRELLSAFDGNVICASFCKRVWPDAEGYGSELLYLPFLEGYESGVIQRLQVQSTGISNFRWTNTSPRPNELSRPLELS